MNELRYETILEAVKPGYAAFRVRQRLLPVGGPGSKVFPPTFAGGVYCWEERCFGEESKPCVLLNSVAAEANHFELALEEAAAERGLSVPQLIVRLGETYPEIGDISSLRAPHRVYDAIFRDSQLDGEPFFKTDLYREFARASYEDATALYRYAPTALLFGSWDSTGSAGGLGNKFARVISSEIIGVGATVGGMRGGVRADPLGISSKVQIDRPKDDAKVGEWEPKGSVVDGDKLKKEQKPSSINHGNILVSGEKERGTDRPIGGGVTIEHGLQTVVLSLAQLRRLRFPVDGSNDDQVNVRARAVLATVGLAAVALNRDKGYALRSRCDLVADGVAPIELVKSNGQIEQYELAADQALSLFGEAQRAAEKFGLPWQSEPVELQPQEKLIELVRLSRLAERGIA